MASSEHLSAVISSYGELTKSKLSNPAATGAPEDQLRAPLEGLFQELAILAGNPAGAMALVGETTLAGLSTRPDYAVTNRNELIGFIEIKAAGKGADPRKFAEDHDKRQWRKLKCLPNLLYTDGNAFSVWNNGELSGKIVKLDGDVETSGKSLRAPQELVRLVASFLSWNPVPPRTAKNLAEVAARLCRLLRDEVVEELRRDNPSLEALAKEWRDLLFPQANDAQFADGYAQAVTFGLLMAKARDISLANGIGHAALELREANSLIGTALRLLTDDPRTRKALETSLDTLVRVLDVIDWNALSKGQADAWLYFYEDFLAVYDNRLRKLTGSYYTPPLVVDTMVRLVDEALRDPHLFGRPMGLADPDVKIGDPAVGTGTYLLGVLRRIASTVENDQGPGAVPGAIEAAIRRLIGFEIQFGPFVVAQLRLIAEIQSLMSVEAGSGRNLPQPRLYITDTLGDPYAAQTQFSSMLAPIGQSRKDANAIKRDEEITVVIGNPPYKEKAKGRGGWIEVGTTGRAAPLSRWMAPPEWGVSAHGKHLYNLYVYFWRWATWKVFGTGYKDSTGEEEEDRIGVVCFITVAGFLNGPGFQKLRSDLRRECSHIWVIDCTPEGHQPEVATRIFQGVQQPVCIVLAVRPAGNDTDEPAEVMFHALSEGPREDKFAELAVLSIKDERWIAGPQGWRAPFLPKRAGAWGTFPALKDLFVYDGSGVMPGRTWVIAPDASSLESRWKRLVREKNPRDREILFHPHLRDRTSTKISKSGLAGHEFRAMPVANDSGSVIKPCRYAFRSFDRQWIIPDKRLINQPNPTLWSTHSDRQIYLTAPEDRTPTAGPSASFSNLIPDLHHYHGRGGRAFPLWRDTAGKHPNIKPAFLSHLSDRYEAPVSAEDVMSYLAAVISQPNFTERFSSDLKQPGLRVPITSDPAFFAEAAALGREVVWLHCYGERMAHAATGRPKGPPRLGKDDAPIISKHGSLPGSWHPLPETIEYDASKKRLSIGTGYIDNVTEEVWSYEVSGKNVLRQWFSYRKHNRSRPLIGDKRPPSPLDSIQPDHWLPEYTTDLMNLLHVLGRLVMLESRQKDLLGRICSGPLLDAEDLREAGALTGPPKIKGGRNDTTSDNQLSFIP